MRTHTYPHAIDNGAGERITFLRRVTGANGDRLEVENEVSSGGPPMHVHHLQAESLTVVEGRIGWARPDGSEHFAGVGETVTFPAGDPHRFWNAGEGPLRCAGYIEPADNIEFFLGELFRSQRERGVHRPDPWVAAFLLTRYRSEFALLEVPPFVVRFVLPLQVVVGRLLGKYRRYAEAPTPVQRRLSR
jgi:mannose-6-phosphate isomerase-like protein (cupin superfamily)